MKRYFKAVRTESMSRLGEPTDGEHPGHTWVLCPDTLVVSAKTATFSIQQPLIRKFRSMNSSGVTDTVATFEVSTVENWLIKSIMIHLYMSCKIKYLQEAPWLHMTKANQNVTTGSSERVAKHACPTETPHDPKLKTSCQQS